MRSIFTLVGRIRTEGLDTLQKGLEAADKQLTKTVNNIDRFGKNLSKIGGNMMKLTAPIAAMGVVAYKGVEAASDLAETVSKVGQIFGESAKDVVAWSETTAQSMGQSKQQALDAASTFAIFGRSAGLGGSELVKFSQNFTTLASDLASFNNTSPEDAITAIGAALRGESEPIRRYGVLLDDATMRAKALELGISSSTKNALTPQQKVLAASALIMEKTKVAQGDFARTSDGLANQTRILKAEIANLTAQFGQAFLPIALQVAAFFRDRILPPVKELIGWWNGLSASTQKWVAIIGGALVMVGPLLIGIGQAITLIKTLWITMKLLNATMIMNPIGLLITSIGLLVIAGIALYKNWDFVKGKLLDAWDAIAYGTLQAVSFIKTAIISYVKLYVDAISQVAKYVPVLGPMVDQLKGKLDEMLTKEKDLRYERKLSREEAKLQANTTAELTATIEAAKQATTEYNDVSLENVSITNAQTEATKKQKDSFLELVKARGELETEWTEKVRQETMTRAQLIEYEYQEALKRADALGADRQDIETYYSIQRMRLGREEADKQLQTDLDANNQISARRQAAFDMGVEAVNQMFSLFQMSTDNKMALIDQETEREKAAINASTMSQEQKSAKIAALEEQADKKKRALQREQAKRDKAAAIFGAIINTFQAVAKALTLGFPLGLIMAAVFGALGAVQIGMIAAQPLPALAEGGLVKKRPGGVQATIGEGNQDELVLPMRTGARDLTRGIIDGLVGAVLPPASPALAFGGGAAAGASGSRGNELHLHIGTLIADDSGLKNLERTLYKFRVSEAQRKGKAA